MKLDPNSSWIHPLVAIPAVLLVTLVGFLHVVKAMKQAQIEPPLADTVLISSVPADSN